jgi:hypothetical protein
MIKLLLLLLLVIPIHAATYYVSPTGSSGNAGTYASPWSLTYGTSQAQPGDTVILKNGTYGVTNTSWTITKTGTAALPILFTAETEYGATIQGPGRVYGTIVSLSPIVVNFGTNPLPTLNQVLYLHNAANFTLLTNKGLLQVTGPFVGTTVQCVQTAQYSAEAALVGDGASPRYRYALVDLKNSSYVTLQGLRIQDSSGTGLFINGSSFCNIQRCVVRRPNPGFNNHAITIMSNFDNTAANTYSNLVEDCIVLQHHRHGIICGMTKSRFNTVRRNYVNAMGFVCQLPTYMRGSNPSIPDNNEGTSAYGASDNLFENNVIVDQRGVGFANHGSGDGGPRNRFLGNVVDNVKRYGAVINSRRTHGDYYITNTVLRDCVIIGTWSGPGFSLTHMRDSFVTNCTAIGNKTEGFYVKQEDFFWEFGGSSIRDKMLQYTNHSIYIHNSVARGNSIGFNLDQEDTAPVPPYTHNNYQALHTMWFTNNTADANGQNLVIDPAPNISVLQSGYNTSNPLFDTAKYGKGAYLVGPKAVGLTDRGAKVLYRYVDGVLTGTALWPWSTEARVQIETGGVGVTYASTGGLFTTLDGIYEVAEEDPDVEIKWHPDLETPTSPARLFESSTNGVTLRIYRSQDDLTDPLSGTWTWGGSATEGEHYTFSGSTTTWTIAAGQSFTEYTIEAIKDGTYTGDLTITVQLDVGSYDIVGTNPLTCDRIDMDLLPSINRNPLRPGNFIVPKR